MEISHLRKTELEETLLYLVQSRWWDPELFLTVWDEMFRVFRGGILHVKGCESGQRAY